MFERRVPSDGNPVLCRDASSFPLGGYAGEAGKHILVNAVIKPMQHLLFLLDEHLDAQLIRLGVLIARNGIGGRIKQHSHGLPLVIHGGCGRLPEIEAVVPPGLGQCASASGLGGDASKAMVLAIDHKPLILEHVDGGLKHTGVLGRDNGHRGWGLTTRSAGERRAPAKQRRQGNGQPNRRASIAHGHDVCSECTGWASCHIRKSIEPAWLGPMRIVCLR